MPPKGTLRLRSIQQFDHTVPTCEGQEGGGREWEGRGGREGKEEGKKRKGKEGGRVREKGEEKREGREEEKGEGGREDRMERKGCGKSCHDTELQGVRTTYRQVG